MKLLNPILPVGSKIIFNSLYDQLRPKLLSEDIMLIALPDDIEIAVGWYPSRDMSGSFKLCVYQGEYDNQLEAPIYLRDPHRVKEAVRQLATRYRSFHQSSCLRRLKVSDPT